VRGAVIDLYPPIYKHPIRIELFGDEVESIRLYDAATQRTLRPLDAVYLHPVRETIPTAGADPRTRILAAADAAVYPSSKTRRLLEQVEEGEQFFGIEALAPAFHAGMVSLFDYLPETTVCVVEEPEAVLDEARRQSTRLREAAASRHVEHRLALAAEDFVLGEDEAASALAARRRLELRAVEVVRVNPAPDAPPRIRVESAPHTTLRADLHQARSAAGQWRRARHRHAAARSPARVAGRRLPRPRRRPQPDARRPPGRAAARARPGDGSRAAARWS
jgi:transcription-repair coupling factor (superfamily II helicase)